MKNLIPVKTFFLKPATHKPLTVQEWQRFAQAFKPNWNWERGARFASRLFGGAIVLKADDSLEIFTLRKKPKGISRTTYKPGKWAWDNGEGNE
jgi:hypothetical protein